MFSHAGRRADHRAHARARALIAAQANKLLLLP
jgi:hypothetical protein